jgi:hypothetical protein
VATYKAEGTSFPRSPCSAKVYHESGTCRSSYHRRLFFILHAIFSRCVCVALSRPSFKSYFPLSSLLIIICQLPDANCLPFCSRTVTSLFGIWIKVRCYCSYYSNFVGAFDCYLYQQIIASCKIWIISKPWNPFHPFFSRPTSGTSFPRALDLACFVLQQNYPIQPVQTQLNRTHTQFPSRPKSPTIHYQLPHTGNPKSLKSFKAVTLHLLVPSPFTSPFTFYQSIKIHPTPKTLKPQNLWTGPTSIIPALHRKSA